jgi:hypothetical protein
MSKTQWIGIFFAISIVAVGWSIFGKVSKIDFNTQIKPIINTKCIACHGGVKQQAGFSLLFREEALAPTKSGKPAIIPGNAKKSELIKRIKAKDPEDRMPYLHDPLPEEEIVLFEKWIDQGAVWGTHWAYIPVSKPDVPRQNDAWVQNDIDAFILDRLSKEDLKPSTKADKATLLRRLSLDITGIPTQTSIAEEYLKSNEPRAYSSLVDKLLQDENYGEKWASLWLDIVRYADSKGYEKDNYRPMWRYKEWLIKALNKDVSYDSMIIRQIAGDLLPSPSDDDFIATAMHRNTMTNDEGGTDNEEFRLSSVMDRVNTTWTSFMGTSFNCVQCHSHPYDPFKHKEYYQFMSFFNNTMDEDLTNEQPYLRHFAKEDSTNVLDVIAWIGKNIPDSDHVSFLKTHQPRYNGAKAKFFNNAILYNNNTAGLKRNTHILLSKNIDFTNKNKILFRFRHFLKQGMVSFHIDSLNGQKIGQKAITQSQGYETMDQYVDIASVDGRHDLFVNYTTPSAPKDDVVFVLDWLRVYKDIEDQKMKSRFDSLISKKTDITPIMKDLNDERKRITNLFDRGSWLSQSDPVSEGVPHVLNKMDEKSPKNRLGLAIWMVDKKNPLVARTMVNRVWEQIFGTGIVETVEDLGTQGSLPSHPELLDHLAYKFMYDFNWSTKALIKYIVSSSTYQQSSKQSLESLSVDPYNRLYARGPRIRLSAEQIRDQNLAVSGLLNSKRYGQPVMPYQPDNIWNSPYSGEKWVISKDGDQYRRAVYTHWKRAAPYPSMINFDGASREVCLPRRIRTNTPIQALTTLNDEANLDLARGLARDVVKTKTISKDQINLLYRKMFYKDLEANRLKVFENLFAKSVQHYKKRPYDACMIAKSTDETTDPNLSALVVVANAMLNLDEWINKN